MRFVRAETFDAMVDGADSGRKKQPFRRMQRDGGIEDDRARDRQGMANRFLHPGLRIGGVHFRARNSRPRWISDSATDMRYDFLRGKIPEERQG